MSQFIEELHDDYINDNLEDPQEIHPVSQSPPDSTFDLTLDDIIEQDKDIDDFVQSSLINEEEEDSQDPILHCSQ